MLAAACGSETAVDPGGGGAAPGREEVSRGLELLQFADADGAPLTETVVWIARSIPEAATEAEFDALDVPFGWFKNDPRVSEPDASTFLRSPDASSEGEFVDEEHFGFLWRFNAKLLEADVPLDEEGLLRRSLVSKYHSVRFLAGRRLTFLISPDDEVYIRQTRSIERPSEPPTYPASWRLAEHTLEDDLSFVFPNPTVVIRADNGDSFQGPLSNLGFEL